VLEMVEMVEMLDLLGAAVVAQMLLVAAAEELELPEHQVLKE
jgi:hypothetical protein